MKVLSKVFAGLLCLGGGISIASESSHKSGISLSVEARQTTATVKPKDGKSTSESSGNFAIPYSKFILSGNMSPSVSYFGSIQPSSFIAKDDDGTYTNMVEYLWLKHKLSDMFSISYGKIFRPAGGLEFYTDPQEEVSYSLLSYAAFPIYTNTGVDLDVVIGTHMFSFALTNTLANYASSTASEGQQSFGDVGVAAAYYGNFAGGNVQPMLTLNYDPRVPRKGVVNSSVKETASSASLYNLGVLVKAPMGLDIQLGYGVYSASKHKELDDSEALAEVPSQGLSGLFGRLYYAIPNSKNRAFVKFTSDTSKIDSKEVLTQTGLAAGMILPTESGVKYMAAYQTQSNKTKSTEMVTSQSQFVLRASITM